MVKIWNSLTLFAAKLLDIYSDFESSFGYNPKKEMENARRESEQIMQTGTIIATVVGVVTFIIVLAVIIVAVVKSRKQTSDFANVVKDKLKENIENEKTKNVCPYCGTRLKDSDNRCSGCGAQRK